MKKVVLSMAALSMLFFVACQGPKKKSLVCNFRMILSHKSMHGWLPM